jgi:hypothetical protein
MKPYLAPVVLAGASCTGLIGALLTDGVIELASTALVALPLLILLRSRGKLTENSSEKVVS